MNREPVRLSVPLRALVLGEFLNCFRRWGIEVASISVGKVHFHVLARFPNHDPRRHIGFAKQSSAAYLRQAGHIGWGGLWGLKSECVPIRDHHHFWKAFGYILDHKKQGSAVWSDPNRHPPPDEFPDPDGLLVE